MKKRLASLLTLALAGCGAGEGDVSGKVKFKGAPLTEGVVTFVLNGKQYAGKIQADGTYRVEHVPQGTAKISVWLRQPDPGFVLPDKMKVPDNLPPEARKAFKGVKARTKTPGADKEKAKETAVKLPSKYVDPEKSGLQYDVKPGPQTKDLDLTP